MKIGIAHFIRNYTPGDTLYTKVIGLRIQLLQLLLPMPIYVWNKDRSGMQKEIRNPSIENTGFEYQDSLPEIPSECPAKVCGM